MADHQAAAQQESAAHEVGAFLRGRREQIAQRWADEALFRTVFTVSRDEAVEAGRAVVEALAAVATAGRVEDLGAAGFATVRDQLGRMSASRARTGATSAQIADEVAALRLPVAEMLDADLADAPAERTEACAVTLTALLGTLRLVVLETTLSAGQELIDRQRLQLLEVATPVIKLWTGVVAVPLIGTLDSARSQVVMESLLEAIVDPAGPLRHPGHHRCAHRRLPGGAAPDEDGRRRPADGRGMRGVRASDPRSRRPSCISASTSGKSITRASLADALAYALTSWGTRSSTQDAPAVRARGEPAVLRRLSRRPRPGPAARGRPPGHAAGRTARRGGRAVAARHRREPSPASSVTGVVIDISGVEIVDSFLGRVFAEVAAHARLLAAQTVVAGMRPAVAITMVELGLTLPGLRTALDVQEAMRLLGATRARVRRPAGSARDADTSDHVTACLPIRTDMDLAWVRQHVRQAAGRIGFGLVDQTKLVTAASELARNTLVHGGGGRMDSTELRTGATRGLRLVFSDRGPGIPDIERALSDGYTSGGGLGLGLGGARRLVHEFSVDSTPGEGTAVTVICWTTGPPPPGREST